MRKKVFICSPFRGDMEGNARKAAAYSRMACEEGHLPIAPHLLFPQFLNEGILVGQSRLLSRKLGYYQAKLDTITQKSILARKTLIRTRKLPVLSRELTGSFRDNIRVSVIIYRVSVSVYE